MEPVLYLVQPPPAPKAEVWPSIAAASTELRRLRHLYAVPSRLAHAESAPPGDVGDHRRRPGENGDDRATA
jgi:hypothetical protein